MQQAYDCIVYIYMYIYIYSTCAHIEYCDLQRPFCVLSDVCPALCRHPSNLMLDRLTGRILHIDFGDCFEVAMTREKFPEKIPFRLTRMLTNAMEVRGRGGGEGRGGCRFGGVCNVCPMYHVICWSNTRTHTHTYTHTHPHR